jgi:hypothetical protein
MPNSKQRRQLGASCQKHFQIGLVANPFPLRLLPRFGKLFPTQPESNRRRDVSTLHDRSLDQPPFSFSLCKAGWGIARNATVLLNPVPHCVISTEAVAHSATAQWRDLLHPPPPLDPPQERLEVLQGIPIGISGFGREFWLFDERLDPIHNAHAFKRAHPACAKSPEFSFATVHLAPTGSTPPAAKNSAG